MDHHGTHHSKRRRAQKMQYTPSGAPLKLPSLPRFHPATYGSSASSMATTPSSQGTSPQPPMSPRSQQRQISEAQRQLYVYQREMLAQAAGSRSPYGSGYTSGYGTGYGAGFTYGATSASLKPESPKLTPMADSPGPVTPLELEGEGYLAAGAQNPVDVDKLLREEIKRRKELSARRQSPYTTA